MDTGIATINEQVKEASAFAYRLREQIGTVIVGQRYLVDRLLVGLLTGGHILLEGVPGLAKTLSVKTLAQAIAANFRRIQFTPDLLPADLIGTMIYSPRDGTFTTRKGPIFAQIVLADEINRAPAKVQSALLEAMQEHQVTIGDETHPLPDPFLVLATQNPIEQEGTYPLPEAQVDRFMLKLRIGYPSREEERQILDRMAVTRNHQQQTSFAAQIAADVVGKNRVDTAIPPVMGAEDFSYMLESRPGAFIFIGNGDSAGLHHPQYNFNDEAIPVGTSYWVKLVETALRG